MRNYLRFVLRSWVVLLFGFSAVFWGNLGQSFFVGWYSDAIKESLALSASAYGLVYSAATLISALVLMWAGNLFDRYALKTFTLIACCGLCAACVLFYLSSHVVVLFFAFLGIRFFGQALLPFIGSTTMAKNFDANRGKAISIAASGVSLGEVVMPLMAVTLIASLGWRSSWLVFAVSVPCLLVPLVLWCLNHGHWGRGVEYLEEKSAQKSEKSGTAILFSDHRYWFAVPTMLSVPFMLTAVFIHQDYVLTEKGWSAGLMASCFVLYGLGHWASSVVFGVLVDRWSGLSLLRIYTLPLILALLLCANFQGAWVAALMMTLLAIPIGAMGPVCGGLWAEVYGRELQGGVRSAAGSISILSTAVSPILVGWFIDVGVSLNDLFNGFAVFFVICLFMLKFSYSPNGKVSHA